MMQVVARTLVLLSVASVCWGYSQWSSIECQTSQECGDGYCCVVGESMFGKPTCLPLRARGESCRPGKPTNATLQYPYGESVTVSMVYSFLCPCQSWLSCSVAGQDVYGLCQIK